MDGSESEDDDKVNKIAVILGCQLGDEGKGKFVDLFSKDVNIVCRCQGGSDASRSVKFDGLEYEFRLLSPALIHEGTKFVIGNGAIIHIPSLFEEIDDLEAKGLKNIKKRIFLSDRAHITFDFHMSIDRFHQAERLEFSHNISTSGGHFGIGPTYAAKAIRFGLRIADLIGNFENFETRYRRLCNHYKKGYSLQLNPDKDLKKYQQYAVDIKPMVVETVTWIHKNLQESKSILVECPNSVMHDLDFGIYPYVSSLPCCIGGVCRGLGVPPSRIGTVIGVCKAYVTKYGDGPFPTEQDNEIGEHLQLMGHEVNKASLAKLRCGWLDIPMLHYAKMLNEIDVIGLSKLDVLTGLDELRICVEYRKDGKKLETYPTSDYDLANLSIGYITLRGWTEDISNIRNYEALPLNAQQYVERVEELLGIRIWYISVGPTRESLIEKPAERSLMLARSTVDTSTTVDLNTRFMNANKKFV